MKIKNIAWLSFEALEAEVTITDDKYEIRCFSQPCHYNIGQELKEPLYAMDAHTVVRVETKKSEVVKLEEPFAYLLTGQLVSKQDRIVEIGNIQIRMDTTLPGDIIEEDTVSFKCDRIDI